MIKTISIDPEGIAQKLWSNAVLLNDGMCTMSRRFDNVEKQNPAIIITSQTNMEETFLCMYISIIKVCVNLNT